MLRVWILYADQWVSGYKNDNDVSTMAAGYVVHESHRAGLAAAYSPVDVRYTDALAASLRHSAEIIRRHYPEFPGC
jgi:hypothetical protein